jgi:6-phosphogluconolactonase
MLTIMHEKNQNLLLEKAARHLGEKLREVLAVREQVNLAVPGGRSVVTIFAAMLNEPVDWARVHFFILDERLVPIDHPDSNYKLLLDHLITPLVRAGAVSQENAHPFILDPASPDRGAGRYERVLAGQGFRYDIILLSAGEDGHVGALFPRHHSLADTHHGFIVMDDAPKPPPERMTSSLSLLRTAQAAILLFVGEAKREAFDKFNDIACPIVDCPAKLVLSMKDAAVFTELK